MVGEQLVIVVKFDGQFYVYLNWCLYLGIELNFMFDQFMDDDGCFLVCVNYGVLFELENGVCLFGLCSGDSFIVVLLDVCDGEIWVGNVEVIV